MTRNDLSLRLIERFHEKWKYTSSTGCWDWIGAVGGKGYGIIKRPGERRQHYAHRLSYVLHVGDLADDALVCHTCDNPACVRPSHLFVGDAAANLRDMAAKDRHLYGSRNTQTKLTAEQVRQMHRLSAAGFSSGEIGRQFGISQGQAWRILAGKRWVRIYREIHARADG